MDSTLFLFHTTFLLHTPPTATTATTTSIDTFHFLLHRFKLKLFSFFFSHPLCSNFIRTEDKSRFVCVTLAISIYFLYTFHPIFYRTQTHLRYKEEEKEIRKLHHIPNRNRAKENRFDVNFEVESNCYESNFIVYFKCRWFFLLFSIAFRKEYLIIYVFVVRKKGLTFCLFFKFFLLGSRLNRIPVG